MSTTESAGPIVVNLDWGDLAALQVQHVNQSMCQLGPVVGGIPDGIYLALGSFDPPVPPVGGVAGQVGALRSHSAKVTPYGRFQLSRQAADDLLRLLRQSLAIYDGAAATGTVPVREESGQ
jgi:hypothetical protein